MNGICQTIQARLFELQDLEYKEFHEKLIPNIAPERIIGVRIPKLRGLARELYKDPQIEDFLSDLPHKYYDENNLHGFLVEQIKDYGRCLAEVEKFLPYIDNWATCDTTAPKIFARHTGDLLPSIERWLASKETYTVRYGIGMLMRFYLDENFKTEYLEKTAAIRSEEYYVNMMIAWYFATALAKQYEAALPFIEEHRLDKWTHNKAIQKACESLRVTGEQKAYLKTLKLK